MRVAAGSGEDGVYLEVAGEALQRNGARFSERERSELLREGVYEVRREDLVSEREGADSCRDHDGPSIEVLVVAEGFTGVQAGA